MLLKYGSGFLVCIFSPGEKYKLKAKMLFSYLSRLLLVMDIIDEYVMLSISRF